MTMNFIDILHYFLEIISLYNFLLLKLILLCMLILTLRYQLKSLNFNWRIVLAEKDPLKFINLYKIKNFYFVWFWTFIYLFIFVFMFLSYRIYRMGYQLDLNPIKQTCLLLYSLREYLLLLLITLFFIILLLLILLVLKKVKNFLEIYMLQKHLYLINYKTHKKVERYVEILNPPYQRLFATKIPFTEQEKKKYFNDGLYKKIFYYFYFFGYHHLLGIITAADIKFYTKFIKGTRFDNSNIFNLTRHFQYISNPKYNNIIPILILIYELFKYNFTIKYLFYFLPFYFLYILWYRLSRFWYSNRNPYLDVILYEFYYGYPNVIYLNLNKQDYDLVFRYISNGLAMVSLDTQVNEISASQLIIHHKRLILYDDNIYRNLNNGECISIEQYQDLLARKKKGEK